MSASTRMFGGPGLLVCAMLDHDDEHRPALTLMAWCSDGTRVEIIYSWGDLDHFDGLPVEVWCETMLRIMTAEQAVDIVQSSLTVKPSVIISRRYRP